MHPHLTDGIQAYPVAIAVAVVVGTLVVARLGRAEGLPLWRLVAFQLTVAAAALLGAKLHSLAERGALDLSRGASSSATASDTRRHRRRARRCPCSRRDLVSGCTAPAPRRHRGVLHPRRHDPDSLRLFPLRMLLRHRVRPAVGAQLSRRQPARELPRGPGWIADGAWSLPVHPLHFYFLALDLMTVAVLTADLAAASVRGRCIAPLLAVHESGKGLLEFVRAADPYQQGHLIQTGPRRWPRSRPPCCSSCAGGGRTQVAAATRYGRERQDGLAGEPNVVLLVVDSLRAASLGRRATGGPRTPFLERLAARRSTFAAPTPASAGRCRRT